MANHSNGLGRIVIKPRHASNETLTWVALNLALVVVILFALVAGSSVLEAGSSRALANTNTKPVETVDQFVSGAELETDGGHTHSRPADKGECIAEADDGDCIAWFTPEHGGDPR